LKHSDLKHYKYQFFIFFLLLLSTMVLFQNCSEGFQSKTVTLPSPEPVVITKNNPSGCGSSSIYKLHSEPMEYVTASIMSLELEYGGGSTVLPIDEVDRFKCLDSPYFATYGNELYSNGRVISKKVKISDLKKINDFYYSDGIVIFSDDRSTTAHLGTFEIISPLSQVFAKDKDNFYFHSRVLENVLKGSFKVLSEELAWDSQAIYSGSFRIPHEQLSQYTHEGEIFFSNSSNEYFYGENLSSMPASDGVLKPLFKNYAKDDKAYYWQRIKFGDTDRNLTILNENYATDRVNVYYQGVIVPDVSPDYFQVMHPGGVAHDDKAVYFRTTRVQATEPSLVKMHLDKFILFDNKVYNIKGDLLSTQGDQLVDLGGGYMKDNNKVFLFGGELTGVNPDGFKYLGMLFFPIAGYEVPMSKNIEDLFFYKTSLTDYNSRLNYMFNPHIPSFEVLSSYYAKDENTVYAGNGDMSIAPQDFQIISGEYARQGESVYYKQTSFISNDVDASSLTVIDDDYSMDANYYYYRGAQLAPVSDGELTLLPADYSVVGKTVYCHSNSFPEIDFTSFKVIAYKLFLLANTSDGLYLGCTKISDSPLDVNTLKYFSTGNSLSNNYEFFGDNQNIYDKTGWVSLASGFKAFPGRYFKNSQNVYFREFDNSTNTMLPSADPDTFVVLSEGTDLSSQIYAMDMDEVFHLGISLPHLDPTNISRPEGQQGFIHDTDTLYRFGKIINGVDVSTVSFFTGSIKYFKDATNVYYEETIIEEADPGSFIVLSYNTAEDDSYTYLRDVATVK